MFIYRKCLVILHSLLTQSGNSHWANWITRDIYEWDTEQSTSHHKSVFGGMGSINDQAIGPISEIGCWQNTLFDCLKSISWQYAHNWEISNTKAIPSILNTTVCKDCGYQEATSIDMEWYLARKNLPSMINLYLGRENFMELTNAKLLMQSKIVAIDREELIKTLGDNNITITKSRNRMSVCPNCQSKQLSFKDLDTRKREHHDATYSISWWSKLRGIFK
ncbi:MAG: hypothetical protein EOP51_02205 [Sphingobacteriales bacterium]|nr:MAG: hypothetical protein EOP51_02205 [Sphingobacteriales bacterium]